MMKKDFEILLYAPDGPEVPGATLWPCLSDTRRQEIFGKDDPARLPGWPTPEQTAEFNGGVIKELARNLKPKELILSSAGLTHQPIMAQFPGQMFCEPFCGYEGIMTDKVAFESYSHMEKIYAMNKIINGRWFDCVIPNYFDMDDFPVGSFEPEDPPYLVFLGRVIQRKGPSIAGEIASAVGMKLIIAGAGAKQVGPDVVAPEVTIKNATYIGPVNAQQRAELLSKATALICPTIYIEPFGGVSVEAMLCGCPVIATDWGAFPEIVRDGSGVRFRTLKEGIDAVEIVKQLDRSKVREYAKRKYSLEAVRPQFRTWFHRLETLWSKGWYEGVPQPEPVKPPEPTEESHLGGFIKGGDPATLYPELWEWLVKELKVKSVLDVGCGDGQALKVFRSLGCSTVKGIDGVPQPGNTDIFAHDFTKGVYNPNRKFDLCWSCEFVEHVEEKFIPNFIPCFTAAKMVLLTHAFPGQAGHHHVNCQLPTYWQGIMASLGFRFDVILTAKARQMAGINQSPHNHFVRSGMVFVK